MTVVETVDTQPVLDGPGSGPPDDLDHWECCTDDRVALCGTDLTDATFEPNLDENTPKFCVVCADLGRSGVCPRTGKACPT